MAEHSQDLLHHINNQDPHIQFTVEPTQQGSLPFLDTLVTIEPDNTFSTTVYRKPTHTDQYLHWDSNHHITAKQSVYNTLAHRAKIVSSTQDKLDREVQHIKTALQHCQFPAWALNQWQQVHPPQHYHHNQQQQSTRQQQKEHHHTCSLHAHHRRKVQKIVQKERNPSTFQGHQHTKDSTRKRQGQGPKKQSNWYHLSLPMSPYKLPQCLHRRIR